MLWRQQTIFDVGMYSVYDDGAVMVHFEYTYNAINVQVLMRYKTHTHTHTLLPYRFFFYLFIHKVNRENSQQNEITEKLSHKFY